jgi:putative hydroxymethylpyrimidine transport system permease protein
MASVRPGVSRRERVKTYAYPAGSLLGMVAVWQLIVVALKPPDNLVPSPRAVCEEFVLHYDLLLMHTWVTTQEMLAGFALSVAVSIPMALAIATGSRLTVRSIRSWSRARRSRRWRLRRSFSSGWGSA